jgi:Tol biopolymer transport system component
VVRVATGDVRPITRDHAREGCPRWSPDGTLIAFHSNLDGRQRVWVAKADGSGVHATPPGPEEQTNPVWAPDGKMLVATDPGNRTSRIFSVAGDGTVTPAPHWLSALDQGFLPVAWAPDGLKIAGTAAGAVWIFDMQTLQYERLMPGSHPTWLTGSRRLIFSAEGRLFLVDVPTRFTREILALPDLYLATPTLSPDDRQLYFTRNAPESNIWLATLR